MAPKNEGPDPDRLSLWDLLLAPRLAEGSAMPTPCRHCGAPTAAEVDDALSLAAFLLLGVLCPDCHARQAAARDMVEV